MPVRKFNLTQTPIKKHVIISKRSVLEYTFTRFTSDHNFSGVLVVECFLLSVCNGCQYHLRLTIRILEKVIWASKHASFLV